MFGGLLGWYTIYTFFGGFCPLTEFCRVQNSLCIKVFRSPILAALLHITQAMGNCQTLRLATRNGIMELSLVLFSTEGATYIPNVAIMLGIGPHSSLRSVAEFGGPQQILTIFASWLRYCSNVAHRRPSKLCTMFAHLLGWYAIYTFLGLLPPDRILPHAKFTVRPSLVFSYIGSVTGRHSSSRPQPNFVAWYKEGAMYIRLGGYHVGHRSTF